MTTTLMYAGLLGLWFFVLSIRVIQGRGKGFHLGDGGDKQMLRLMRGHANFAEYVPLTLLLIGMLEMNGTPAIWIHALGASLFLGRLLHGYAFCFHDHFPIGRSGGTGLTLLSLIAASALAVWQGLH